jgi:alkylhydroperoxidase/carboxymuconolactone decarboxylase family protein YurZ
MSDDSQRVSSAFQSLFVEAPDHAIAWMNAAKALEQASALDAKTRALAYLAVLAAMRLESGVLFHTAQAKAAGASRDEIISAVLIGVPAAGNGVVAALPAALAAFDHVMPESASPSANVSG